MSVKRIEHRQADAAQLQAIDQLLQVDGACRILGRVHLHVTGGVHREVAVAPARHLVQLARVVHAPRARRRGRWRRSARGVRWSPCSCAMHSSSSVLLVPARSIEYRWLKLSERAMARVEVQSMVRCRRRDDRTTTVDRDWRQDRDENRRSHDRPRSLPSGSCCCPRTPTPTAPSSAA